VVNQTVTDINAPPRAVRCPVSGCNAPTLFDLRYEVREKRMAFVAAEPPAALTRQRLDLGMGLADQAGGAATQIA
jgi:hypothetical protein